MTAEILSRFFADWGFSLVYKFSLYHLMDVDGEQTSLFPRKVTEHDFSTGARTNGHSLSAPAVQELKPSQLPKLGTSAAHAFHPTLLI